MCEVHDAAYKVLYQYYEKGTVKVEQYVFGGWSFSDMPEINHHLDFSGVNREDIPKLLEEVRAVLKGELVIEEEPEPEPQKGLGQRLVDRIGSAIRYIGRRR
jgi:hypothetical protein